MACTQRARVDAAAPPEPEEATPIQAATSTSTLTSTSSPPTDHCAPAVALAQTEHPGAREASRILRSDTPLDLDRDGVRDCVLTTGEFGRNATYYLYVMRPVPRYVGAIAASPLVGRLACRTGAVTEGLCELRAGEMMIHGETQTTSYRFDGRAYAAYGSSQLSRPHPKFGP